MQDAEWHRVHYGGQEVVSMPKTLADAVPAFRPCALGHLCSLIEIDQLEQNRARNPSMEALYIVLPTTDNIERICADF